MSGLTTSIRIPPETRRRIDELIQHVYDQTGTSMRRSEFILESIYYYFDYLYKQEKDDLIMKALTKSVRAPKRPKRVRRRNPKDRNHKHKN